MNADVTRKYARKWNGKKQGVIFGLDGDQFSALETYIFSQINKDTQIGNSHYTPKVLIGTSLHVFGSLGHSLVGMYNFLIWAQEIDADTGVPNIESDSEIMATLGHDLNGMKSRLFAPRTESYEDLGEEEAVQ